MTERAAAPRRAWLLVLMILLAVWLVAGAVRAETVARDYFATAHGEGVTVAHVQVEGSGPAIPPFWSVTITGWVIVNGSG